MLQWPSCRAGAGDGALVGMERAITLERLMSRSSAIPPVASQNEFYIFFLSFFLFSALFSLSFFSKAPVFHFFSPCLTFLSLFLAGQHRAPWSCRLETEQTKAKKNKSKRKEKKTTSTRVASREAPWLSSWHDVLLLIIRGTITLMAVDSRVG